MRRVVLPALFTLVAAGPLAAQPAAPAQPEVRGVTISCQTWGREWGSDDMVEALRELAALGVNWVAIHPYAGIRADGSVGSRHLSRADGGPRWLTRPIAEAHRLGIKILIKPHLAYWGSPFSWRGEIGFGDDAGKWERFFQSYERWIVQVAEVCHDADGFVVGTELRKTVGHEQAWRDVIAAVRAKTQAPLTYAANWDDYHAVPFWDALDVIGVQGYFPLVTHQNEPCRDELALAWTELVTKLEAYGQRHGKKVVLTELGYDKTTQAARKPWESGGGRGGQAGEAVQQLCLEAALDALGGAEPHGLIGAFLWKWFPGRTRGEDFLMSTPAMRQVIRSRWLAPERAR